MSYTFGEQVGRLKRARCKRGGVMVNVLCIDSIIELVRVFARADEYVCVCVCARRLVRLDTHTAAPPPPVPSDTYRQSVSLERAKQSQPNWAYLLGCVPVCPLARPPPSPLLPRGPCSLRYRNRIETREV